MHVLDSPNLKHLGAYYTPPEVVAHLTGWVESDRSELRVLDPACGDGRFLQGFRSGVGVDVDSHAVEAARSNSPHSEILQTDFFEWAASTRQRFDAVVGNPPFIRFQRFSGASRKRALAYCQAQGVELSALSSSWAPFVVGAGSLLHQGGRLAFVVPAEIGYAVYARPVIRWLVNNFSYVEIVAFREKLFPSLSEDCYLLRASGYGSRSDAIRFVRLERFDADEGRWGGESVTVDELATWGYRLRPLILDIEARETYHRLAALAEVVPFGSVASIGIGYVTGANSFFHMRPSEARERGIPSELLRVAVRSNRDLHELTELDDLTIAKWLDEDRPNLLLDLARADELPQSVQQYLATDEAAAAQRAYKCRARPRWYAVPDVVVPDAFLSVMASKEPRLVANTARAVCTNSVHVVRITDDSLCAADLVKAWNHPLTRLSCELEGHALGGGMLKLEPQEARRVILAFYSASARDNAVLESALGHMRRWRNAPDS